MAVYGCVVLGQFAAQVLPRSGVGKGALAVMDGVKPWELVYAVNGAAHRLGIRAGMTRVEVETYGGVEMVRRSVAEERAAEERVLACMEQFSPRIQVFARAGVDWEAVLDLSGTERLLGRAETVGGKLLGTLDQLGLQAWVTMAGNADAGLSLARFRAAQGLVQNSTALRCQVMEAGRLREVLRLLPVGILRLEKEQAERFEVWGIRTLGELGELGEDDLILRMGQAGKTLRERARGEFQELLQPKGEVFRLEECMEFEDALETLDQVLFCLNPMLEGVIARAGDRALAVASVELSLVLERSVDRVEGMIVDTAEEVLVRRVQPAVATLNRALLLKLLQLELEAHPVPGAIVRIALRAEAGKQGRIQLGLFAPQMPEPTRFEDTYARLSAIVGDPNLGRLRALDTHAREEFALERFRLPGEALQSAPARAGGSVPAMALRRIRPPAEVKVWAVDRRIESFVFEATRYTVTRTYGPWRTSGDWWGTEAWSYDAWDVAANNEKGEVLLCVLGFDLLHKRWQMEGLYD